MRDVSGLAGLTRGGKLWPASGVWRDWFLCRFRQSHVIITVTRTAAAHGSPKNDIAGRFSMQRWRTPRCVTFIAFSIASARLCLPKIVNRAKVHQRASCAGHLADGVRRPSAGSSTLRHCNRRTVRSRSPRIVKPRRRGGRRGLKLAWQVSTGGTCSYQVMPSTGQRGHWFRAASSY